MSDSYTSPEDEEFFAALGRSTISWAHLEAGLDFSVITIHQRLGGDTIEQEQPRSLSRKLTYLRKAFERLPALAMHRENAVGLIGQICEASETRHDLIHGFVVSHNLTQSVETKMSRILWHEAKPRLKNFTVSARSAMEHAAAVNRLANQFLSITVAIVDRLE